MSRKSRKTPKLELVTAAGAGGDPPDDDTHLHILTGKPREIFDALVFGCIILDRGPVPQGVLSGLLDGGDLESLLQANPAGLDDSEQDPADEEQTLEDEERALDEEIRQIAQLFADFEATTHVLTRALISELVGKPFDGNQPTAFGEPVDIGGVTLDELIARFDRNRYPRSLQPTESELENAFDDVDVTLREIGLEEFDRYCTLGVVDDTTVEIYAEPISRENASLMLMDLIFDRGSHALLAVDESLRYIESAATTWEFDRWSAPFALDSTPEVKRELRADEYTMIDRPMIALGDTAMVWLTNPEASSGLPPRQDHMARCLADSFIDVFEVTALEGTRATWRSIAHNVSYTVYAGVPEGEQAQYERGWIVAGRLIPFDDDLHLASGSIFASPPEPGLRERLAATYARFAESLPSALALEAMLSSEMFGKSVPIEKKPAASRADARLLGQEIDDLIADGVEIDDTIANFRKALKRQADTRGSAPNPKGSKKKRRR